MAHISLKKIETWNWLPLCDRIIQYINFTAFKYVSGMYASSNGENKLTHYLLRNKGPMVKGSRKLLQFLWQEN